MDQSSVCASVGHSVSSRQCSMQVAIHGQVLAVDHSTQAGLPLTPTYLQSSQAVSGSNVQKKSVGRKVHVPLLNSNAPVFPPQPQKPQPQSHQTIPSHQSAFSPSVDLDALAHQYQQHTVSSQVQSQSAVGPNGPGTQHSSAFAAISSSSSFSTEAMATSDFKPVLSSGVSRPVQSASRDIGNDMWRQLKRVSIPIFKGDKKTYEGWKVAFLACIDQAPLTPEYKLLQLREYPGGEALKVVENLGHSAAAYDAAKSRLERKYGGERRQMALHLEELGNV